MEICILDFPKNSINIISQFFSYNELLELRKLGMKLRSFYDSLKNFKNYKKLIQTNIAHDHTLYNRDSVENFIVSSEFFKWIDSKLEEKYEIVNQDKELLIENYIYYLLTRKKVDTVLEFSSSLGIELENLGFIFNMNFFPKFRKLRIHNHFPDNMYINLYSLINDLKNLNYLKVTSSKYPHTLMGALENNSTLTELNIGRTSLKETGVALLAKAMKNNLCLKKLIMPFCEINNEGCELLLFSLAENRSLRELDITSNLLNSKSVRSIIQFLKMNNYLETFDISSNDFDQGDQEIFEALFANESIKQFTYMSNPRRSMIKGIDNSFLTKNTVLKNLNFSHCECGDSKILALCNYFSLNNSITELNLQGNKITSSGAGHVSRLLITNKSLTKLNLSHNDILAEGGISIMKAMQWNTTLQELELRYCKLSSLIGDELQKVISTNKILSYLDLTYNDMGCISKINFAMTQNTTLKYLNLASNDIRDSTDFLMELKFHLINDSITHLDLYNCNINEHITILSKSLIGSSKLIKILNLSRNEIGDEESVELFNALTQNISLESIILSNNKISDKGCQTLSKTLSLNTKLKILNLSFNRITTNGLINIFTVLKINKTLKVIDLGNNIIDEVPIILKEVIETNRFLEEVDISSNSWSYRCYEDLVKLSQLNIFLKIYT
jgi:Ran GTPase-activating protein (RanGAP) involved in mRNA processing and transport